MRRLPSRRLPATAGRVGLERVERLHHRDPDVASARERGQAAGPGVGVHDIRSAAPPALRELARESGDMREQFVIRKSFRRAGRDVLDRDATARSGRAG